MQFIVRWEISQATRKETIKRFLETGGAPPAGAKMLQRWHSADGEFGFAIAESDDIRAMAKWAMAWNDLIPMDIRPVLNDEGMGAVLSSP